MCRSRTCSKLMRVYFTKVQLRKSRCGKLAAGEKTALDALPFFTPYCCREESRSQCVPLTTSPQIPTTFSPPSLSLHMPPASTGATKVRSDVPCAQLGHPLRSPDDGLAGRLHVPLHRPRRRAERDADRAEGLEGGGSGVGTEGRRGIAPCFLRGRVV